MRDDELRLLGASFRVLTRQFESFSEHASQAQGLTSLQYQTLFAITAGVEAGPMTVSALAQVLIVRHNSAVGLLDRIEQLDLVVRRHPESDRRCVVVEITARGRRVVRRLATQHRLELLRISSALAKYARAFSRPVMRVS